MKPRKLTPYEFRYVMDGLFFYIEDNQASMRASRAKRNAASSSNAQCIVCFYDVEFYKRLNVACELLIELVCDDRAKRQETLTPQPWPKAELGFYLDLFCGLSQAMNAGPKLRALVQYYGAPRRLKTTKGTH